MEKMNFSKYSKSTVLPPPEQVFVWQAGAEFGTVRLILELLFKAARHLVGS